MTVAVATADKLVAQLRSICGPEHTITHEHQLRTYESDGLLQYAALPRAAVLPGNAEEVQRVVTACHDAGVPIVARGAGSGLSGGALPHDEGVLIVLSRMRRILEVDLDNQRIVVEPGVTNLEVGAAVGPSHYYPPDPSSQVVCSIGGNVAENSGGAHCFKYGFTTNYVTGLEVVLPDGEVVQLGGGKAVDAPGYDLLGAFVGSEGTLGVATKITLRVIPAPPAWRTLVAFYAHMEEAGRTVSEIVSAGLIPGAMEIMDKLSIQAAEGATGAGYPTDAGAALVVELDGPEAECDAALRRDQVDLRAQRGDRHPHRAGRGRARADLEGAQGGVRGDGPARAELLRAGQRHPAHAAARGADAASRSSSQEYDVRVANVFHAGDGNLHPLVLYDAAKPGEAERAEECAGEIVKACVDLGGSITGEHGVGVDKKRYMPSMFGEPDLAAFQMLRCAFDPAGLANPDKLMPTPRLCGEVPGPYRQHPLEAAGLAERF